MEMNERGHEGKMTTARGHIPGREQEESCVHSVIECLAPHELSRDITGTQIEN